MGSIKKALNKVTGRDKVKEAEEAAKREAERQAEIDAAQKAQQSNEANAGAEVVENDVKVEKESDKKKTLKGGRKSLTVARGSGSGINV